MSDDIYKKAAELTDRANRLYEEVDDLLEPLAKAAADTKNIEEIRRVADLMPQGNFYRTELKTYANVLEKQANSHLKVG